MKSRVHVTAYKTMNLKQLARNVCLYFLILHCDPCKREVESHVLEFFKREQKHKITRYLIMQKKNKCLSFTTF